MKKILSLALVMALLLCAISAFSAFAADPEEIATVDAYLTFVQELNNGTRTGAQNVKITADLDFEGKTYEPINKLENDSVLDFDGHTVKNLNYTVAGTDNAEIGLIVKNAANRVMVKNLTLKDSSITVTGNSSASVGGVVGRLDRAAITNISTDNFTVNSEGTGNVGLIAALEHWCYPNYEVELCGNLKDATINAPGSTVGILIGWAEDWDGSGMHVAVKNLTGNVTIKGAKNVVTEDTMIGNNRLTAINAESAFADNQDQYFFDSASVNITFTNTTPAYTYQTIDTPEEFAGFTKDINNGVVSPTGTVKVTADLDMKDIADFQPINRLTFILDFDGHTVSNLVVTNNGTDGYAGLIVNRTNNHVAVANLKLKNCKLITNGAANVGIVMGHGDRSIVEDVTIENVTVDAQGATNVGGVIGARDWGTNLSKDMSATLNDVIFNVNGAQNIGILVGATGGNDLTLNVKKVNATKIQINNEAEGFDPSAVGAVGSTTGVNSDNAEVTITLASANAPAVGYVEPADDTTETGDQGDDPTNTQTGDIAAIAIAAVAVMSLAGVAVVATKRRKIED